MFSFISILTLKSDIRLLTFHHTKVWRIFFYYYCTSGGGSHEALGLVELRLSTKIELKCPDSYLYYYPHVFSPLLLLCLPFPLFLFNFPLIFLPPPSLFDIITSPWQEKTEPLVSSLWHWAVTGTVTTQICADITSVMEDASARSAFPSDFSPHQTPSLSLKGAAVRTWFGAPPVPGAATNELDYNASSGGLIWQMDSLWTLPTRLSYKSRLKSKIFLLSYKLD